MSSDSSTEKSPPKKKNVKYEQKFVNSWLKDDRFKGWFKKSTKAIRTYEFEELTCFFMKMWDKVKTFWSKTNRWHRVLLLFFIVELRIIPGGQVGFECNDPTLSHPFTGDTVNFKWLIAVTVFVPLIMILLVERQKERSEWSKQQALRWYKEYLFGLLINVTTVQLLKLIVGSPRPHFFETCQPIEAETCKGSEYVSSYTCTQAHWLKQSDKSFPSGHTSLSVHCGVFIMYYVHRRAREAWWARGVQLAGAVGAAACSLSRVHDRRHHWGDVLGGAALATPVLLFTIFHSCKNFECLIKTVDCPEKCESDKTEDSREPVSL